MKINHAKHENGHIVRATTPDGETRSLPVKLPFKHAVSLAEHLSHLKTGASSIPKAANILREAFAEGLVKPVDDAHHHHFAQFSAHCAATDDPTSQAHVAHTLSSLIHAFIDPARPFAPEHPFFSTS